MRKQQMQYAPKLNDGVTIEEALACMADILCAHAKEEAPLSNQEMRRLAAMLDELAAKAREMRGRERRQAEIRRQALPLGGNVVLFPVRGSRAEAGER